MKYRDTLIQGRKWIYALLIPFFIFILFTPLFVSAGYKPCVLRVPFIKMDGLMETAADGTRHGLVIDYLDEIAKYTGWEYEYIDTDGESATEAFINGEYDLMGASYYLPVMEQYFAYPDYTIGYSKAVLLARMDDDSINTTNVQSLNGKTIGVYERAIENIRRLNEFLTMNNLDCTLKSYSYEQLMVSGNLYPYLENGEVDLLLGNNTEQETPFRIAFAYDSQPYYIVTHAGNQEILDGLNMAMKRIMESNPDFAQERYDANFPKASLVDVSLHEEEIAYIQQNRNITVAVPQNFHPLNCQDEESIHSGLTIDILDEVSAFTGINFCYLFTDSYREAMNLVQQGDADMMGFFLGTNIEATENNLVLTASFASMSDAIIRNKKVKFPDTGLVGAVIEGRSLPNGISAEEVLVYPNAVEAISAVNRGEVDFVFGLSSYLESILQKGHYANVIPTTISSDRNDISFALARPADPELLTILNKALYNISAARKVELLDQNMISSGSGSFTITEIIYANPILVIGIVTSILFILGAAAILIARAKIKAAVMQGNLEKAEAESRAKGEFLSRMSHELRTPMNAVVGLANIISMTEGLPDTVRRNLSKLQASSYYLLDLINDILDTSRLDSGMLTIAREPFSLSSLLDKIQDMMETEARRREIDYSVEI